MTKFIALNIALFCFFSLEAQNLKFLDYKEIYKNAGVKSEVRYNYYYENDEVKDSCLVGKYDFDKEGRVTKITSHFACGMRNREQYFHYGEGSSIDSSFIQHMFHRFKNVPFELILNEDMQIIERRPTESIRDFWSKETYSYHSDGSIAKIEQWKEKKGKLEISKSFEFSNKSVDKKKRLKNNMTDVYDENGLQLLHHIYTDKGLRNIIKYYYEFHE